MKLLKILPLFALLFLFSCNDAEKKETDDMDDMAEQAENRDPAEINKEWIDSWNKNDAASLDSLTAGNAVLYMQGKSMSVDSIRAWYKESAPLMKDLQTTSERSFSGKDLAYDAGTFKHGIKGDSLGTTYEGAYTIIWKRTDKDWKLQVLNITDKTPDSTATAKEDQ